MFLSLTDSPGTLLPLLALELVHLDEEGVGRVVQLGLEAVAEPAYHLHVLADHLDNLAADLDHGLLIVADLGHGAPLGLLKFVTRDLLEVSLLEVAGLVCEIHKVFSFQMVSSQICPGGDLFSSCDDSVCAPFP